MTRRRLMFFAGGAVLLGLLALAGARSMQDYQRRTQRADDRYRAVGMAEELQARARVSGDLAGLTPHVLIGAMEGAAISPRGEYALALAGTHPAWAGTTITFSSAGQSLITITVTDLAAGQWELEESPLPGFWEFWK